MVGASSKAATVCACCGERRKKFPSSWTLNDCVAYCPKCWEQVKCAICGHHDPKGALLVGCWACRGCRHKHQVKSNHNLHEDCHRVIIEDGNGEGPSQQMTLAQQGVALQAQLDIQAPEEDTQAEDEEDEVSALPEFGPTVRQPQLEVSHIVVLIDASGSMRTVDVKSDKDDTDKECSCRLDAAITCAAQFVHQHSQSHPRDLFSLAMFADAADVVFAAQSAQAAEAALTGLARRGSGGTSFRAALGIVPKFMSDVPSAPCHIVMLSDGRPADTKAALEFFQAEFLNGRTSSMHLHGIGFGGTVESFAPLQQLACLSGGTFELSSCTTKGLCKAFGSVSSTITSISTGCLSANDGVDVFKRVHRVVRYEPPELGVFGQHGVLRFSASRSSFQYDGTSFKKQSWTPVEVARRISPCMRGGMRLVYAFRDAQVVKHEEDGSWMVAKSSRFVDEISNSLAVVETHAKSTAVARYFAACFNEQLQKTTQDGIRQITLFFVPCFVYSVEEDTTGLTPNEPRAFAGERYLPGAFLKYNSNNGYVSESSARHHEVIQAFTHFTFAASGGSLMVADLQGVAREAEVLLTDPQVLSLDGSFGPGDIRARGLCACLAAHRCGPTCKRLGLSPVSAPLLRRLGVSAAAGKPSLGQGKARRPRPASGMSDGWENVSQQSVPEGDWERVKENDLHEFALSDGVRSSQGSASSWTDFLDM